MTNEIPSALAAYHPGVGHVCHGCGRVVVDAIETPGEPFRCLDCGSLIPTPEDELTRAAMEDRGIVEAADDRPTVWRLVVVIAFAVVALAIVFWKR
ncbi:hypothetical protein GETHOR_29200 [Geothrix oryzae]|jgi:DNA-directed RNA polymerase subunit N (RpoN/RPB10)|uniref:Uncharacterized protein n=1 Tax=Geothrix oryzae TaxID=2927975 RepID=A0ABM8DUQ8_9BACT|nr:hypothetical protein [Geothrix oryzae]BDU70819.1 hypothetical protein GETHOR_29200 [Geothrix oryzae]